MLLLLDVYGLRSVTNYILLLIVKSPNTGYIVLYNVYMTISVSIGLYPKLNSRNVNKLQLQLQWLSKTWFITEWYRNNIPVNMDIVVVFPAPLWPSSTVIWPSYMFNVRSFTAIFLLYTWKETTCSANFAERTQAGVQMYWYPICVISGFHSAFYKDCILMGSDTAFVGN
jgi:hypothetical protein